MRPAEFLRPVYPVSYVSHLLEVASLAGVAPEKVLHGMDEIRAALQDPRGRLTHHQAMGAFAQAEAAAGHHPLPVVYGKHMHLTWHGHVGQAVLASRNLRDALSIASRFAATRSPGFSLTWEESARDIVVYLDSELGNERAERFLAISLLTFFAYSIRRAFDTEPVMRITIASPAPQKYAPELLKSVGSLIFDEKRNSITFPASLIDIPSRTRDDELKFIALEACQEELHSLAAAQRISDRVRSALRKKGSQFPAQEQVCKDLGMTCRSMARKLADEGVTYRDIVNSERVEIAKCLLCSSEHSILRISEQLGYSDASNFARAFKKHTGISPVAFRQTCT